MRSRGVASNYVCDLKKGDEVRVIGPFGTSFLMPNHPNANLIMICTGHRLRADARDDRTSPAPCVELNEGGKLMLFFGARTQKELPYFGPLMNLPKDFIDINFAFSREARRGQAEALRAARDARARRRRRARCSRTTTPTSTSAGSRAWRPACSTRCATSRGSKAIDWPALHARDEARRPAALRDLLNAGRRAAGPFGGTGWLRWTARITLGALLVVLVAIAIWIVVTQRARGLREVHEVDRLAAGKGRWVRVDDAALYVQEWGRPD